LNSCCCCYQEAEKEAELAKQKKAENAEKKKQAKNKSKAMQAQSATQNKLPTQTEIRPYSRSRPIGQTSKPDTSVDQSETRAPADSSSRSDVPQPAVYVRGQKRKVKFVFNINFAVALILSVNCIVNDDLNFLILLLMSTCFYQQYD